MRMTSPWSSACDAESDAAWSREQPTKHKGERRRTIKRLEAICHRRRVPLRPVGWCRIDRVMESHATQRSGSRLVSVGFSGLVASRAVFISNSSPARESREPYQIDELWHGVSEGRANGIDHQRLVGPFDQAITRDSSKRVSGQKSCPLGHSTVPMDTRAC